MTGCISWGSERSVRLRCVALASLLVLAALRCGGPPEAHNNAIERPHFGGVLKLIQEVPSSLDPVESESVYESLPINQIFDTLVTTNASLNVAPSLAESWQISRDGLEYEFHLRQDVFFHDGVPLTAVDVVFTFKRVLQKGGTESLAYPYLLPIRGAEQVARGESERLHGVQRIDDHTVRFSLIEANPLFLEQLAMDNLAIVPAHVFAAAGEEAFTSSPIGTGPFVFEEWSDSRIRLRRYPEYHHGPAFVDAIELNFYREGEDDYGEARLLSGELDALEPASFSMERLSNAADVDIYLYQELSLSFLGLNTALPPLDQEWLRRAIAHAIDRDRMIALSPTVRRHAPGMLPPGIAGFTPEEKGLAYSPERAREILAKAGHPDGVGVAPIRLYDPTQGSEPDATVKQLIEDIEAVGLDVELVQVTWAEMGERLDNGTCAAFLLAWIADMSDPDAFLSVFGENGTGNMFEFHDKVAEELLRNATIEYEPRERGRLYRKVERYVLQQAPLVPLYHTRGVLATRGGVQGMRPGPYGLSRLELERVWFKPLEAGE